MDNFTIGFIFLVVFLFFFGLYFTPTIIVLLGGGSNKLAVILINLFLGWTCIGWIISLVLSLKGENKIIIQNTNNFDSLTQENKLLKKELEELKNKVDLEKKYGRS